MAKFASMGTVTPRQGGRERKTEREDQWRSVQYTIGSRSGNQLGMDWTLGQDTWRGTGQQHGSLGGDGGINLDFMMGRGWYI